MALALDLPEAVLADIRVLGSVDYEPLVRQARSEVMVIRAIDFGIRDVLRAPFEAALADNHRAALAGFEVLGNQQNAVGEYVGPDIQNHLVAAELWGVVDKARPRIHRHAG